MITNEKTASNPRPVTVMYFGAGRGPLIMRAINAAVKVGVELKVIALDKNPNAIITLRNVIVD